MAQRTKAQLHTSVVTIRNETGAKANTANRVGSALEDIKDSLLHRTEDAAAIKLAYESNANTNAFTDADKSSLEAVSQRVVDSVRGVVIGVIADLGDFTVAQSDITYVESDSLLYAPSGGSPSAGVYTVGPVAGGTASLFRRLDLDTAADFVLGFVVPIREGDHAGEVAVFKTSGAITLGVTSLEFSLGTSGGGKLSDPGANGLVARTALDTTVARTLTGPAAGITITNGNGVSGNPTLALADDLAALEGLSSTGLAKRTGTSTWETVEVSPFIETLLNDEGPASARATLGAAASTDLINGYLPLSGGTLTGDLLFSGAILDMNNNTIKEVFDLRLGTDDNTATSGTIRMPSGGTIHAKASTGTTINLLTWTGSDGLVFGSSSSSISGGMSFGIGAGSFGFSINGDSKLTIGTNINALIPVNMQGNTILNAGSVEVHPQTAAEASLHLKSSAGQQRAVIFWTDETARWRLRADSVAESGSNAGSDFELARYNDAGTSLGNVLTISRATGLMNINAGLQLGVGSHLNANGNTITNVSSMEVQPTGGGGTYSLKSAAGQFRSFSIYSDESLRWIWRVNADAESGSNAGSDMEWLRYDDSGNFLGFAFRVTRSSGRAEFFGVVDLNSNNLTEVGSLSAANATLGTGDMPTQGTIRFPYGAAGYARNNDNTADRRLWFFGEGSSNPNILTLGDSGSRVVIDVVSASVDSFLVRTGGSTRFAVGNQEIQSAVHLKFSRSFDPVIQQLTLGSGTPNKLTIAGQDNNNGAGGNLELRGGTGTTSDGSVIVIQSGLTVPVAPQTNVLNQTVADAASLNVDVAIPTDQIVELVAQCTADDGTDTFRKTIRCCYRNRGGTVVELDETTTQDVALSGADFSVAVNGTNARFTFANSTGGSMVATVRVSATYEGVPA